MKRHEYAVQITVVENIVEMVACYGFSRIETLKSERLFTYLNLNARRSRVTTTN